ncbi:MAG: glycosyltransferase, partial [Sphaerochaetaceae bacterium]
MSNSFAIILTLVVLGLDVLLLLATLIVRFVRATQKRRDKALHTQLLVQFQQEQLQLDKFKGKDLLRLYNQISPTLQLNETLERQLQAYLVATPAIRRMSKRLTRSSTLGRIEAASKLRSLAKTPIVRDALLAALKREKNQVVALYIFQALARVNEKRAIIVMMSKLYRASPWMAGRYRALLLEYKSELLPYLLRRLNRKSPSMRLLICEYALLYSTDALKEYLAEQAVTSNKQVRTTALKALCKYFPKRLINPEFTESTDRNTLPFLINAYANIQDPQLIPEMLAYANHTQLHDQLVQGLTEMSERDPSLISLLLSRFENQSSVHQRKILAKVLDNRLSYVLESNQCPFPPMVSSLVTTLAEQLHISGLTQFLNTTKHEEKQKAGLSLIKKSAQKNKKLRELVITYVEPDVLEKIQLKPLRVKRPIVAPHQEHPQRLMLVLLLVITLLVFPLLILATELPNLVDRNAQEIFSLYVVRFNYLLVYYSVAINVIYLAVLAVSFRAANTQNRLWRAKDRQMLFTKGLLPSVSIIAPAYNEASNIIESTNSLLNQHYPDYELIVVNDGSKDTTLKTLIEYYSLERQDKMVSRK